MNQELSFLLHGEQKEFEFPNPNDLKNWDGYGRKGQAAYDRQFEFEKSFDDIMYVIDNQMEHSEEEVEAAYAALQKYK